MYYERSENLNDNFQKLLWISPWFEKTVSFAFRSICLSPRGAWPWTVSLRP